MFYFFLEQTTGRQTFCSGCRDTLPSAPGLELRPECPQNKIGISLHPKYTHFSCILIICSSEIWKSFDEIGVTYVIIDILKEADWILFQAFADNFCYVPTILLYISWKYKYWYIQKDLCDVVRPLDKFLKRSFFTWSLLVKSQSASLRGVCFD